MTVELAEKLISAVEGLRTDLYGIKVSLVIISVYIAFGIGVFVVKALRKGD